MSNGFLLLKILLDVSETKHTKFNCFIYLFLTLGVQVSGRTAVGMVVDFIITYIVRRVIFIFLLTGKARIRILPSFLGIALLFIMSLRYFLPLGSQKRKTIVNSLHLFVENVINHRTETITCILTRICQCQCNLIAQIINSMH